MAEPTITCQVNTVPIGSGELVVGVDAASLMAVFAAVGWAIGMIIHQLPAISSQTRATAAAVRDHALISAVLAGIGSGIRALADFALEQALSVSGAGEISHGTVVNFYFNSAQVAGALMVLLGSLLVIGPAIPLVGTALTFAAGVLFAPAMAVLGIIFTASIGAFATYYMLHNAMFVIFPVGMVLIAVPGRVAKGLGAFLVSLAIVSYVTLPIVPVAMASIASVGGGSSDTSALFSEICGWATGNLGSGVEAFLAALGFGFVTELYRRLVVWLILVVVGGVMLAVLLAAARALSHSLGGVSASI